MTKDCLYCDLLLPDTAEFCPECGRHIEDAILVGKVVIPRDITTAIGCLYCDLQLPDSAEFCPECGRHRQKGLRIHPIQDPEFERLCKKMKGKDELSLKSAGHIEPNVTVTPVLVH